TPEGHAGSGDEAAVQKLRIIVNANQPAPSALADERTDLGPAEIPGHGVAAGASKLVDDHHFRPEDRAERRGEVRAFARRPVIHERPTQIINDVIRGLAAAVEALIDDRSFFANLSEVVAVEIRVTVHR